MESGSVVIPLIIFCLFFSFARLKHLGTFCREYYLSVKMYCFFSCNQPAFFRSCKDIRDAGYAKGDGRYIIDPENNGNPMKVYCDMRTDGGKTCHILLKIQFSA